jgi:putative colanic acid biosynthesis UDP-glucose lipid carrier transferase
MSAREVARKLIASRPSRTAVMVGATSLSSALHEKISADAFLNVKAIGFFDDRDEARLPGNAGFRKLGTLADVPEYVKNNAVDTIYLCLPIMWHDRILTLLEKLRDTTASIYYVPDVFMADLVQARIDRIGGMPTIAICETPFIGLKGVAKRLTDIVLSVLLVLVIWPIFLLIAIGIKLTSKGNVLYKQERYGLDGERIVVYKFRTMYECETGDNITQARPCDDRVTKLGRFLRTTSLDELPQLFNVLRGDMSLVGPRPHAVAHNEMYRNLIKGYMVRHKVKPGITGLAQVNGLRGETDTLDKMQARVDFDLEYLRNWSLTLDALIMLRSVRVILGDSKAY